MGKTRFSDLWRPTGVVDRGTYAFVGVLSFALKHNIDRLVATYGFHRPWRLFSYWVPLRDVARITSLLGAQVLTNYGWGLFVALPFALGFAAAVIHGWRQPRSAKSCIGVACLSTALLGAALLALAFEGMICLVMAMPIALPLAAFGGACGYFVQRRPSLQLGAHAFLSVLLIFVPGVHWTEHAMARAAAPFGARS